MQETNRFEFGAKIILYILAALLPIFFVPFPIGVEFGREVVFSVLIILGAIFWFLSILKTGEIRFQLSPILYAALLLLAVFAFSTVFSKSPSVSFFLADSVAEKLTTLILGLVLMVLAGGVFKSREEVGRWVFIFLFSGAVAGILNILQMTQVFQAYKYLASFASGVEFNVIGTANGLALFYGALFVTGVGLLFSSSLDSWKWWMRYGLFASLAVFLANLFLINFRTGWIILLGSTILLFGLKIRDIQKVGQKAGAAGHRGFDWQYLLTILVLIVSVFMILVRTPFWQLLLPAEVTPTLTTTLGIVKGVFKEGPKTILLGSGPGTFGLDWGLYKDTAINQTVFWSLRFNQGFSWLATLPATAGIFGFLSLFVFLGVCLFLFLKNLLLDAEGEVALGTALFLGFSSLVLASFLYPANFTLVLLLFLSAGFLSLALAKEGSHDFWSIGARSIKFESPWLVFLSSLAVVLFLSLGVAALYFELGSVRAAFAKEAGAGALNKGEVNKAIVEFERAVQIQGNNFGNLYLLAQARTEKMRGLIQRASAGENVQDEFRTTVVLAIQNMQKAVEFYPVEPILWRAQGALYELLIPFIPGAEGSSFDSYRKAAEYEPGNPAIWVDLGRAHLVLADRLQSALGQASGQERQQAQQLREEVLKGAEQVFQKAVEVKADFAPAHFLLAQTSIRLGDSKAALASIEKVKLSAPFDVGVAFQLGLLYYQNDDFNRAQAELERAVSLNQNYSNARYFLGLIYDRRGDKQRAIKEFEQIEVFNPDNQEVKRVLANLRAGKSALESIVPPAEPPEKRKETPVKEGEEKKEQQTPGKKK